MTEQLKRCCEEARREMKRFIIGGDDNTMIHRLRDEGLAVSGSPEAIAHFKSLCRPSPWVSVESPHNFSEFKWCDTNFKMLADVMAIIAFRSEEEGCVVRTLTGNKMWDGDGDYYGSVGDLFYEGAETPKEPGVYLFSGKTHSTQHFDECQHHGEFIRVDDADLLSVLPKPPKGE